SDHLLFGRVVHRGINQRQTDHAAKVQWQAFGESGGEVLRNIRVVRIQERSLGCNFDSFGKRSYGQADLLFSALASRQGDPFLPVLFKSRSSRLQNVNSRGQESKTVETC